MLILALAAHAAEGVSCSASWGGPTTGCPLTAGFTTAATRSSVGDAERAARRELARVLDLTARDLVRRVPARSEAEFGLCEDAAMEQATVDCSGPPAGSFCFVTFDDDDCWNGAVLTVDHGGWRGLLDGRAAMCDAVDARLVGQGWEDLDARRAACQASCLDAAEVSCPPDR
jgi:hypothetical protein